MAYFFIAADLVFYMRAYYLFLRANVPYVGFGWLITFFSSFGQTFLISLYVPEILSTFSLSNGEFGTLYALCTIAASAIMLRYGPYVDFKPVRHMTYVTVCGLAMSTILLGLSYHPAVLVVAITGLRLTGQGMMSHISLTIMSRYYDKDRGKALSLSSLGYSVGEALFPVLITTLILGFGWRWTAIGSGLLLLAALLPVLLRINLEELDLTEEELHKVPKGLQVKEYGALFRDRYFWIIAPASFMQSFIVTSLFFYQLVIAKERGWPYEIYSLFFIGYAVMNLCFSLIGGSWVDTFSARKVFIYHLLPLLVSLAGLAYLPGLAGAVVFLFAMGVAVGLSNPVKAALIAEIYGVARLGAVRSLFTMVMVLSTALGPMIVGNLLDFGFNFESVVLMLLAFAVVTIINGFRISK